MSAATALTLFSLQEHALRNPDPDDENATREAQDQLSAMKESVEQNRGVDHLLD